MTRPPSALNGGDIAIALLQSYFPVCTSVLGQLGQGVILVRKYSHPKKALTAKHRATTENPLAPSTSTAPTTLHPYPALPTVCIVILRGRFIPSDTWARALWPRLL